MFGKRLHPVALGCIVSRSEVTHAEFASQVGCAFRDFTAHKGISPETGGLKNHVLRSACAPSEPANRTLRRTDHQYLPLKAKRDMLLHGLNLHSMGKIGPRNQLLLTEKFGFGPGHLPAKTNVVSNLFVYIKRQMEGEKIDVCHEQCPQATMAITQHP